MHNIHREYLEDWTSKFTPKLHLNMSNLPDAPCIDVYNFSNTNIIYLYYFRNTNANGYNILFMDRTICRGQIIY